MATDAQLTQVITAAAALVGSGVLTEQNLVYLMDRAIADAAVNGSGMVAFPYMTTGADGVSYTQIPMEQAIAARAYYREEVRKLNPPGALNPEYAGPFGGTDQDPGLAAAY